MKNTIYLEIDTDNEQPIVFGKPPEFKQPETVEEARVFILNDITCLCESLCTLILIAHENKYSDKESLVKAISDRLNDMIKE